ncbi:hypothetical protein SAMN04488057_12226 [Cyclobacterium lianum]|uniref:Uncharacterized protein n=1 Tax=Cyclobacterium lianum TaxID=388280 RepID=A0A1M7QR30_9BACT|nr:hypothetical protein [Cyclobacterium lianum]SHN33988.1 hypothetical protein SAMN04488057_12226 [Cyclobacterium lianum]
MRVVRETSKDGIRISLFDWNNKYLLKFESGMLEQTFKIPVAEIVDEHELDGLLEGPFFVKVKERFQEMNQSLHNAMENF